jgi:hypothetical protein
MDMIPIHPERKAQLDDYAQRRGQDAVSALDEVLSAYFEWERQDFEETVQGIRRGHEDVKAGRTRPAELFLDETREKHGIPRDRYPLVLETRRGDHFAREHSAALRPRSGECGFSV